MPKPFHKRTAGRWMIAVSLVILAAVLFGLWRAKAPDSTATGSAPVAGAEPEAIVITAGAGPGAPLYTDDPRTDGWDTEQFNNAASEQFAKLAALIEQSGPIDPAALAALVTASCTSGELRPASLRTTYEDEVLMVRRPQDRSDTKHKGATGLAAVLEKLREPFAEGDELHVKFKIFNIDKDVDRITTRQHLAIWGR